MIINHNIPSIQAYNALSVNQFSIQKAIERLSTGLRINSAADDAAGLAISEKMRAQIHGLDRAAANAQDGISMIQTAEGALGEIHSIIQRMRELSVQAANDTLTQQDRGYIQLEIDQLREETSRISSTTQFNKKKILDGSAAVLWSSSDLLTRAIINGGLRTVDQFGQKSSVEGNYKLTINAAPGKGEVMKTNIFTISGIRSGGEISGTEGSGSSAPESIRLSESINKIQYVPGSVRTLSIPVYLAPGLTETASSPVSTQVTHEEAFLTPPSGPHPDMILGDISITVDWDGSVYNLTGASGWFTMGNGDNGTITGITPVNPAHFTGTGGVGGLVYLHTVDANGLVSDDIVMNLSLIRSGPYSSPLDFEWAVGTPFAYDSGAEKVSFTLGVGDTTYNLVASEVAGKKLDLFDVVGGIPTPVEFDFTEWTEGDIINAMKNGENFIRIYNPGIGNVTITYTAEYGTPEDTDPIITDYHIRNADVEEWHLNDMLGTFGDDPRANAALSFEVTGETVDTVTLAVTGTIIDQSGVERTVTSSVTLDKLSGGTLDIDGYTLSLNGGFALSRLQEGDKFSVFYSDSTGTDTGITVRGSDGSILTYNFNAKDIQGKTLNLLRYAYDDDGNPYPPSGAWGVGARVTIGQPGDPASWGTSFQDTTQFWNSEGRFLLDDPKTITITQGDGRQTTITIYASDTIESFVKKLNDAIGYGLGQIQFADVHNKFAQFVSVPEPSGALTVRGTIVISSITPGADGMLYFSGDEEIIKALGLNVIREAEESSFVVSVSDAHSGKFVAKETITGNRLYGVVHENVDVMFDLMSDTTAVYNTYTGFYDLMKKTDGGVVTILHLADNTTVFQIGANESEDMSIHIGDMSTFSLGLNRVLVVDREAAARSVTIIDSAIRKVSSQRAKLGAYQNRLEHTISNLTAAETNLTSAESRIRDADMAKEMINFTKLNILIQSGMAMSAQANQIPQAVLTMLR